jgi:hypothetical protein
VNFQPQLAAEVLAGTKTVTRRLVSDNPRSPWWRERCALEVGRDYAVCPGRGKPADGRVRIVSVRREPLARMTDAEARLEGFESFDDFKAAWCRINGGEWFDGELVWRVEFVLAEIVIRPRVEVTVG